MLLSRRGFAVSGAASVLVTAGCSGQPGVLPTSAGSGLEPEHSKSTPKPTPTPNPIAAGFANIATMPSCASLRNLFADMASTPQLPALATSLIATGTLTAAQISLCQAVLSVTNIPQLYDNGGMNTLESIIYGRLPLPKDQESQFKSIKKALNSNSACKLIQNTATSLSDSGNAPAVQTAVNELAARANAASAFSYAPGTFSDPNLDSLAQSCSRVTRDPSYPTLVNALSPLFANPAVVPYLQQKQPQNLLSLVDIPTLFDYSLPTDLMRRSQAILLRPQAISGQQAVDAALNIIGIFAGFCLAVIGITALPVEIAVTCTVIAVVGALSLSAVVFNDLACLANNCNASPKPTPSQSPGD